MVEDYRENYEVELRIGKMEGREGREGWSPVRERDKQGVVVHNGLSSSGGSGGMFVSTQEGPHGMWFAHMG